MATTFHSTLGALLIGFAGSSILYGVLTVQTHAYFQRFTHDRPFYKWMVTFIWGIETLHQALVSYTVYHYNVSNFNNILALLVPVWSLIAQVLVGAIISVVVKFIFTIRVWRFSGNNILLTLLISVLNISVLVLATVFSVIAFQLKTFAELPRIRVVTSLALGVSVSADIIIAASLTYFLHHLRNNYSANTLANGLIRYSIETGAVTSLCGIMTVIFFNALPRTFIYLSFFFVLSKLYSNSLLATLNTRKLVRGRGTDRGQNYNGEFSIIHATTQTGTNLQSGSMVLNELDSRKPHQLGDIEVNVSREVSVRSDAALDRVGDRDSTRYSTYRDPYRNSKPPFASMRVSMHRDRDDPRLPELSFSKS